MITKENKISFFFKMTKKEFTILAKKGCPHCKRLLDFMEKNKKSFTWEVYTSNVDFQNKEFKDKFGKDSTYPRVYEVKKNGKLEFVGGASETIEKFEEE